MNDAERIIRLHQRLRVVLAAITEHAEASVLERCPYRDATDLCTFTYGCRNQLPAGDNRRCSGVRLNIQRP